MIDLPIFEKKISNKTYLSQIFYLNQEQNEYEENAIINYQYFNFFKFNSFPQSNYDLISWIHHWSFFEEEV